MICLRQIVFNQKIIYTKFLLFCCFGLLIGVDSCQYASVLVEITGLDLYDLALQHCCDDLFDLLAELLDIALACLGCVHAVQPEGESGECLVQVDDALDCVAVDDFGNLGQEYFVVEGEFGSLLNLFELLVFVLGEVVGFAESNAFRQKGVDGLLDDLLFVHFHV